MCFDVSLGLVSMESYAMTRCSWGMLFFSSPLKCSAYSDLAHCGAHKWLVEEKGMDEKRVGSRFKSKAPIGTPFLLSNLLRHKKSNSLIPKGALRKRKEVLGQRFLCQSVISSAARCSKVSVCSSLCSCNDRCSCLGPEAEPAFFLN